MARMAAGPERLFLGGSGVTAVPVAGRDPGRGFGQNRTKIDQAVDRAGEHGGQLQQQAAAP